VPSPEEGVEKSLVIKGMGPLIGSQGGGGLWAYKQKAEVKSFPGLVYKRRLRMRV